MSYLIEAFNSMTSVSVYVSLSITLDHECKGATITPKTTPTSISYTINYPTVSHPLIPFTLVPTTLSCYNIALLESN